MEQMLGYSQFIADRCRQCNIVAHRGAWHYAPENSVPAVEQAIMRGYEIVEVDVQRSRDGVLFLLHDPSLGRMAGRDVVAQSLTMRELTETALRNGNGGTQNHISNHGIPTLEEILRLVKGRIFLMFF
jgi:glycerophosphoryl diester phosphodiesterase